MSRLIILALFLTISFIGKSQAFTFIAGNLIEKNIILDSYEGSETKIVNESDVAVTFGWELITADFPAGWETMICDYELCYFFGETMGTMSPVDAGSTIAFLRMNVTATSEGVGTFQFMIYDEAFPEANDTITMIFNAIDDVSLKEESDTYLRATLTNSNTLLLANYSSIVSQFSIYNLTGALIATGNINADEIKSIDTSLPSGIYFVRFEMNQTAVKTSKIIIP